MEYIRIFILEGCVNKWKWDKQTWQRDKTHPTFVLKVIYNERKILIHHEIIDRSAEQTESVITQACKVSELRIHPNLSRPICSFNSFTHSANSLI